MKKKSNADKSDEENYSEKKRIKKNPIKESSSSENESRDEHDNEDVSESEDENESEDKKYHTRKVTRKWTDKDIKANDVELGKYKKLITINKYALENKRIKVNKDKDVKPKKKKSNSEKRDDENNPKTRRIKKNLIKESSSSETDSEDEKTHRRKITHRKWTDEEIKAVKKHLHSFIQKKINPGKAKCLAVLKKEPVLHNRTWMQLNTYVNNIYKNK